MLRSKRVQAGRPYETTPKTEVPSRVSHSKAQVTFKDVRRWAGFRLEIAFSGGKQVDLTKEPNLWHAGQWKKGNQQLSHGFAEVSRSEDLYLDGTISVSDG